MLSFEENTIVWSATCVAWWKFTDISEERIASIFRVEEQKTYKQQANSLTSSFTVY
jgi:hypothetical protein